jgi:SAM-dependent methyltransferase
MNMHSTFEAQRLSESLACDAFGIWRASRSAPLSYPDDGNAACFRVEDGSFWFSHRNRCITEAVRQWQPPGFILDVGGGNGYVARGLIEAGYETVLLEPGDEGARNARSFRQIPHVICATLDGASFKPASIPAVGLFDVLEHIEDDERFIQTVIQVLRPAGRIYLTVPAHQWLWSITDVEAGHFRRYSTRQLSSRFTAAGFDVLYATYFFEALVAPFYLLRTLPFQLGFRGRRDVSRYEAEHAAGGGFRSRALLRLLEREPRAIAAQRTLATGTSCLLVAQKPAAGATTGAT